jgi:hypothetical protein
MSTNRYIAREADIALATIRCMLNTTGPAGDAAPAPVLQALDKRARKTAAGACPQAHESQVS